MHTFDPTKDYRDAIATLDAHRDVFGNVIRVGSLVRCFRPDLDSDGTILGFEREGDLREDGRYERAAYHDGIVEAIGEDVREGCPRYRVRVIREVYPKTRGEWPAVEVANPGQHIYPPVNGVISTLNGRTFYVVALRVPDLDPARDYRPEVAAVTGTRDLFGREIRVGSLVRSFASPVVFHADGRIDGFGQEDEVNPDGTHRRVHFIDGVVTAIGETDREGCPRYTLAVVRRVSTPTFDATACTIKVPVTGSVTAAPLNGLEIMGREHNTFGVVVL